MLALNLVSTRTYVIFFPDFDCANFISFDEGLKSFVNWVKTQNIEKDLYDNSVEELKKKGLIR